MRIEGKISQNNETLIDGCICKGENKFQTRFIVDTGFTCADVAVPANIAAELSLSPSSVEICSTPTGPEKFHKGDDALLRLGGKSYKISYIIYHNKYPLISINFLKNISEVMIVDFVNNLVVIILK